MKNQCEAVTRPSSYTAAHRCLKKKAGARLGGRYLCTHHKAMSERRPS
jgi:hypothetical protein